MTNRIEELTRSWRASGNLSSELKTLFYGYTYPLVIRTRDLEEGWKALSKIAVQRVITDKGPRDLIALRLKVGAFMAAYRDLGFSVVDLMAWLAESDPKLVREIAMHHFGLVDPKADATPSRPRKRRVATERVKS